MLYNIEINCIIVYSKFNTTRKKKKLIIVIN